MINKNVDINYNSFVGIHEMFEAQAVKTPDHVAVRCGLASLTYKDLDSLANQIASDIHSQHLVAGDKIAILLPRSVLQIASIIGVLKSGCAYVPIDVDYPEERIKHIIDDCDASFIITSKGCQLLNDRCKHESEEKNLAYIIYTSGSTGKPKGVLVDHVSIIKSTEERVRYYGFKKLNFLLLSSVAFDSSLAGIFWPLSMGGELVILEPAVVPDPYVIAQLIGQYKINGFLCVPSLYQELIQIIPTDLENHLEFVIVAGESCQDKLLHEHVRRFPNVSLYNEYGPTEATVWASVAKLYDGKEKKITDKVTIGKPIAINQFYIMNENGEIKNDDISGELCIAGINLSRGYYKNDDLTKSKFVSIEARDNGNKFVYRTGDLVKKLSDGRFEFIGRMDEQIKINGYRIEPGEIEEVIRKYDEVIDVIVTVKQHAKGKNSLIANIKISNNFSEDCLRVYLKKILPVYMCPMTYIIWDQFPITPNGKIDKKAMSETVNNPGNSLDVASDTSIEGQLKSIWRNILSVTNLSAESDFFALGGDSIDVIRLSIKARERGLPISVEQIFLNSTIAALSAAVFENLKLGIGADSEAYTAISDQTGQMLSPMQEGLYLQSLLSKSNKDYFIQDCYYLDELLDHTILIDAWTWVVNKFDILRTGFSTCDVGPVRNVIIETEVNVPIRDISHHPETSVAGKISEILSEESNISFDIKTPPLARISLVTLKNNRSVIILGMHHILMDGWSIALLMAKLLDQYHIIKYGLQGNSFGSKNDNQYLLWQQLQDKEKAKSFWKNYLNGFHQSKGLIESLSYDVIDIENKDDHSSCKVVLPDEVVSKLYATARNHSVTINSIFQLAWAVILSRYLQQEEVVFGITVSGRHADLLGLDSMLGLFINTLPLRININERCSLRELLISLKDQTSLIQKYSFLSLAEIQAITQSHHCTRHGIYDHFMAFLNHPDIQELRAYDSPCIEQTEIGSVKTEYPLSIAIYPDKIFKLEFVYNKNILNETTLQSLATQYVRLLEIISENINIHCNELSFLTDVDNEIISKINDTTQVYDDNIKLQDFVGMHAKLKPADIAIIDRNIKYTYSEVDELSNKIARAILALGVKQGDSVAVCMDRSATLVCAMLGIHKIGAVYVPIDCAHPDDRIEYILNDSRPVLLVLQGDKNKFIYTCPRLILEPPFESVGSFSGAQLALPLLPVENSYIVYTSGSTGFPKGVINTYKGIENRLMWSVREYGADENTRLLHCSSIGFDISIWEMYFPLLVGGRLVIAPKDQHKDARFILDEIDKHKISIIHFVPSVLSLTINELNRDKKYDVRSVRSIVCGGERLTTELHNTIFLHFNAKLHHTYGPSESSISVTNWTSIAPVSMHRIPLGRPISNVKIFIMDEDMRICPVGVPGEICVAGVAVASGYLNQDQLNKNVFIKNSKCHPNGDIYKTGDYGRYLSTGLIDFLGRKDSQIKLRGVRIELSDVDQNLVLHDKMAQAVSIIVGNDEQMKLFSFVVPEASLVEEISCTSEHENIESWRKLYDDTYAESAEFSSRFNTNGWRSSYTGEQMSDAEMHEWVDSTVSRIEALNPKNVLELGCGTGLILFNLGLKCTAYTAVDFSKVAIDAIKDTIIDESEYSHIKLIQGDILDVSSDLLGEKFDTIVINSVSQYLPSKNYLKKLITICLSLLSDDGAIFIGDIRNYDYISEHHASIAIQNFNGDSSLKEFKSSVARSVYAEEELLISPSFLLNLENEDSRIANVQVLLKSGKYSNEMNKFRYDVAIRKSTPEFVNCSDVVDAEVTKVSISQIELYLKNKVSRAFKVEHLRNSMLYFETILVNNLIASHEAEFTISEYKDNISSLAIDVIDPYELQCLANKYGYEVAMTFSNSEEKGHFDAYFWAKKHHSRKLIPFITSQKIKKEDTNNPQLKRLAIIFEPVLRRWLKTKIPDYMMPNHIVFLNAIPLNPNGKVSIDGLRSMVVLSQERIVNRRMPINAIEKRIHDIWCETLGFDAIDIDDNFFSLGGHSLLASKLMLRMNDIFMIELSIKAIFTNPTISSLSQWVASSSTNVTSEVIPKIEEVPKYIPLSSAQKRLWILDKIISSSSLYNMPFIYCIEGDLDIDAVRCSFDEICNRHTILRTVFKAVDSEPYQEVLNKPNYLFNSHEIQQKQDEYIKSLCEYKFNLENGPLMLIEIIKQDQNKFLLMINMHHIIADGWSIKILIDEFNQLYSNYIDNKNMKLDELRIQYKDYALWHNLTLIPKMKFKQAEYWKRHLEGAYDIISLPYDFQRPLARTYKGNIIKLQIDIDLLSALKRLASRMQCTLYVALLSIFKVILTKYIQNEDVIVGSPVANRHHHGVENLIGFFVNMVALRTNLNINTSFEDNLNGVKKTVFDALNNQDMPFEEVVKLLKIRQDPSRHPIFQVVFALEKMDKITVKNDNLMVTRKDTPCGLSKFDLTLRIYEYDDEMQCEFEYALELFDDATIARLAKHFLSIVESVCDDSSISLRELTLCSTVLNANNSNAVISELDQCWHHLFEKAVLQWPKNIALEYHEQRISYESLNTITNNLARYFQQVGVSRNTFVGLCLPRSPDLIIATLAIMKLGAVYIPLDDDYPDERLHYMLHDSQAKILVTHSRNIKKFESLDLTIINIDTHDADVSLNIMANIAAQVNPDDLAYIIYTSGSTGKPKGVMVQHHGLVNLSIEHAKNFYIDSSSKMLQFSSYSFDASVLEYCTTLSSGGTLVLADKEDLLGDALIETMNKHQVTVAMPAPSLLAILVSPKVDSLKTLVLGGEPSSPSVIKYWLSMGVNVINSYGPTETTVCACFFQYDKHNTLPWNTIGKPLANVDLYILDNHYHHVPAGVSGQLFIGGTGVTKGYLNQPELTSKVFVKGEMGDGKTQRLYATGDLVRLLPDENIEYLGRIDNQVKIRGFRIELGEIENILCEKFGVVDAVAVVKEENDNKYIVAYIIHEDTDNKGNIASGILLSLKKWLPTYMVPRYIELLDKFPLTANGKVDRNELSSRNVYHDVAVHEHVEPRNLTEECILTIYKNVLNVERVSIFDDFFDLGGHSLLAIKVVQMINAKLSVQVPHRVIFQCHSIAELATYIASPENHTVSGAVNCLNSVKSGKPLFLVHPIQGTSTCYHSLSRLFIDRPIFGFDNPYLGKSYFKSISEMAEYYVNALIAVCPSGDFDLAGWSFGGILAVEMSHQLLSRGRLIDNLFLVDSFNFNALFKEDTFLDADIIADEVLKEMGVTDYSRNDLLYREITANTSLAINYVPVNLNRKAILLKSRSNERLMNIDRNSLCDNGWTGIFSELSLYELSGSHHRLFDVAFVEEIHCIFSTII